MAGGSSDTPGFVSVAVNHEHAATGIKDFLEQLPCESGESIPVGNHNLLDTAVKDSFQKGLESASVPVEPRSNVLDHGVPWVGLGEILDLSLQVRRLVLGRHSGVDDLLRLFVNGTSKQRCDVPGVVEAVPTGRGADPDFPSIAPADETLITYFVCCSDSSTADVSGSCVHAPIVREV